MAETRSVFLLGPSSVSETTARTPINHSGWYTARVIINIAAHQQKPCANTGLLVSTYTTGLWSAIVTALPAALLCGGALALLFPAVEQGLDLVDARRSFFGHRRAGGWLWRVPVASVAFVPIYFAFGLLVLPFVRQIYEQGLYGLREPAVDRLFAILFVRSILFVVSCLPVTIAWQGSRHGLFLGLGFALFVLVAYPSVLVAYWLPVSLRLPHALEILADEFVYAGALVALLTRNDALRARAVAESMTP